LPNLFRVFPHVAAAKIHEPGGALYVPSQGGGRVDNPSVYAVLYLGDSAPGAIAEAFGRFPEWRASMLRGNPTLPDSRHAIARYRLADDAPICNLDDPQLLVELALRPSDIVSRDYDRTRRWARQLYTQNKWHGLRWWSYYNSDWASFALWDVGRLTIEEVTPLELGYAAIGEAARTIFRSVIREKQKSRKS